MDNPLIRRKHIFIFYLLPLLLMTLRTFENAALTLRLAASGKSAFGFWSHNHPQPPSIAITYPGGFSGTWNNKQGIIIPLFEIQQD